MLCRAMTLDMMIGKVDRSGGRAVTCLANPWHGFANHTVRCALARGSSALSWQQSGNALQGLRYDCRKHNKSGYKDHRCLTLFCSKGTRAICQLQGELQAMHIYVPWANIVKLRDKLPRGPKARLLLCMYSLGLAPTCVQTTTALLC